MWKNGKNPLDCILKVRMKPSLETLIEALPPGLTFQEAALRLGVDYQACRRAIQKYGYRASDGRRYCQNSTRKLVPEKIDWRKSNIQIARELLISRERVRVVRSKIGKPLVESRGRKSPQPRSLPKGTKFF